MKALRDLLENPLSPHLDEEMAALLADLEAQGADVDGLHPAEAAHLGHCVACATRHADLVELLLAMEAEVALELEHLSAAQRPEREKQPIWGQLLTWVGRFSDSWAALDFRPKPDPALALLAGSADDDQWTLAHTALDTPLPLTLTVTATRHSETLCDVTVRVDRVGLRRAAGREIVLESADFPPRTIRTDANGRAVFHSLPITALPNLTLRIALPA